jgi:membrane protease YdiL (CAAX protease family)
VNSNNENLSADSADSADSDDGRHSVESTGSSSHASDSQTDAWVRMGGSVSDWQSENDRKGISGNPSNEPTGLGLSGLLCWLVILGITGFILLSNMLSDIGVTEQSDEFSDPSPIELTQAAFQAKGYVAQEALRVWAEEAAGKQAEGNQDKDQPVPIPKVAVPQELDRGTLIQRWCYTVLLNEAEGPAAALEHFRKVGQKAAEHPKKMTERQQEIGQAIETLLQEYEADDFQTTRVDPEVRSMLQKELGWFGDLLLAPAASGDEEQRKQMLSSAQRMFWALAILMIVGLLAILAGFVLLVVWLILTSSGKIRSRLQDSPTPAVIYLQTFTIWLLLFLGLQLSLGMVVDSLQLTSSLAKLLISGLGFFGSLVALWWPLLRGVSLGQMLQDLGLNWSPLTIFKDGILAGFAYLAVLPVLLMAVILVALLSAGQSPGEFEGFKGPSHPVQPLVAEGDGSVFLGVLFLACVAAPIVEEIMFRGVLYRHLRSYSRFWALLSSIVFACLLNSFIFAAIHPQGLLGIPLLMALAIGFSLVREYRDSLFAPIVMHAINNFIALTVTFFIFR